MNFVLYCENHGSVCTLGILVLNARMSSLKAASFTALALIGFWIQEGGFLEAGLVLGGIDSVDSSRENCWEILIYSDFCL